MEHGEVSGQSEVQAALPYNGGGGAHVAGVGHVVPTLTLASPALPHPTCGQVAPHHLPQTPGRGRVVEVVQEADQSPVPAALRGKVPTPLPLQLLLET